MILNPLKFLASWQGYAAVALIAAAGAWTVQGWRYGAQISDMERNQAAIAQAQAEDWTRKIAVARGKELAAAQAYADIDALMTAQLKEKQDENNILSAAVSAGTVRLRLAATCTARGAGVPATSGATSVDNGGTAELNAAARPTYNALRAGIVQQRAQILALQALLREATSSTQGPL